MRARDLQHYFDVEGPSWHVLLGGNGLSETNARVPRLLVVTEFNGGAGFDLLFTFPMSPIVFHAQIGDVRLTVRSDGVSLVRAAHYTKRGHVEPASFAPVREPELIAEIKRWERDCPRTFPFTRLFAEEHCCLP